MTPIEFPECNIVIGKNQPPYTALPAHAVPDDVCGRRITCWQMSPKEMATLLDNGGVLWLDQLTFNEKLQPIRITVEKPEGMGEAKPMITT